MQVKLLLNVVIAAVWGTLAAAKEPELPPCPSNIEYFPQNLPMHCRMTRSVIYARNADKDTVASTQSLPYYQNAVKLPGPLPFPIPPGVPGPFPVPMPPMPMMPIAPPAPSHKLPVIVMPFYSPDPHFKSKPNSHRQIAVKKIRRPRHRKPYHDDSSDSSSDKSSDTSSDTSSSSSDETYWKSNRGFRRFNGGQRRPKSNKNRKRKHNKRKENLVTPMIQYVTKDGYVIFEKKISDGEAREWLKLKNDEEPKMFEENKVNTYVLEKEVEPENVGPRKLIAESHQSNEVDHLSPKEPKPPRTLPKKHHQHKSIPLKKISLT